MLLAAVMSACAGHFEVRAPVQKAFDAVIVPGCPTLPEGGLSKCLQRRAVWAAMLWERGQAAHFITSGAAVHTPFIEAEALGRAMHALGIPKERIFLETHALHTDENVFNSLRIAQKMGFARLGIASERGQALGACQMLAQWHAGGTCGAFVMETSLVEHRRTELTPMLLNVSARKVEGFLPLAEREKERAARLGRKQRPPSYVLYPVMTFLQLFGKTDWRPFHPEEIQVLNLGDYLRAAGDSSG